ncbi:MAG TPA: hypothetical protein VED01_23675 [Burkholderiales bacterium]|nr:hypothetical protein [Burkholderiales bacterium]
MKKSLAQIDDQIREVENRIAVERIALDDAVNGCTNSLREVITSPKTLLALLGVGFAVGKIAFGRTSASAAAPAKKAGMLGLLTGVAGTALSLAKPGLGWGSVARWAAAKYFSDDKPKPAARAAPRAASPAYPRTPAGV